MLAAEPNILSSITIKAALKEEAISNATVQESLGIPSKKGEFVLYFKEEELVLYFRKPDTEKIDVFLEIKSKGIQKEIHVSIEEGKSTYVGYI